LDEIRQRLPGIVWTRHALARSALRELIQIDVLSAIRSPTARIIEEYPTHHAGPACLLRGFYGDGEPLHIVLGTGSVLTIITVYDPRVDPKKRWSPPDDATRGEPTEEHS
jgi:hypothetical protein